jgi:predicted TIM-barrel fold metal-dependent hydrolase
MALLGTRHPADLDHYVKPQTKRPPLEGCRRFFADTASFGSREAIECGVSFFGSDRLLFATDMPFDPGQGPDYIHSTLAAINALRLSEDDRKKLLVGNACKLFNLSG